jgi:hypothetical protein
MRRVWDSTTRSTLRDSEHGKNCVLEVDAEPGRNISFLRGHAPRLNLGRRIRLLAGLSRLNDSKNSVVEFSRAVDSSDTAAVLVAGSLLVLFYRVSAVLVPPQSWGRAEAESNRRAFLRLWCWTVALAALQVGAMYMDSFTMGVH